MPNNFWEENFI